MEMPWWNGEYQGNPDTNQTAEDMLLANSDADIMT